jgi:hypothetical protein
MIKVILNITVSVEDDLVGTKQIETITDLLLEIDSLRHQKRFEAIGTVTAIHITLEQMNDIMHRVRQKRGER